MSHVIDCTGCGGRLSVPDRAIGKKVRCPKCSIVNAVPAATSDDDFEVVEDEFEVIDDAPKRKLNNAATDGIECPDCGEINDAKTRRCDCGARLGPQKPKRKKKKKAKQEQQDGGFWGLERNILSGGVLGGLIAMVVAVVWFVVGYENGRIFFYPPVLFVVGLVATIRGAAQES